MRSVQRSAYAGVATVVSVILGVLVGAPTAWAQPAPPIEPGRGNMPEILPAVHVPASTPTATAQGMDAWQLAAFGALCAAVAILVTVAVTQLVSRHRAAPSRSAGALA